MKKYTTPSHFSSFKAIRYLQGDFKPHEYLKHLPKWGVIRVEGSIHFTVNSSYLTHLPSNQSDWNKGGGLSHSLRPSYNAIMLGWRWLDGGPQLSPYLNIKGENYYDFPPFLANLNVDIPYSINYFSASSLLFFQIGEKIYVINKKTLPAFSSYKWGKVSFPRSLSFGGDDLPLAPLEVWWKQKMFKK